MLNKHNWKKQKELTKPTARFAITYFAVPYVLKMFKKSISYLELILDFMNLTRPALQLESNRIFETMAV